MKKMSPVEKDNGVHPCDGAEDDGHVDNRAVAVERDAQPHHDAADLLANAEPVLNILHGGGQGNTRTARRAGINLFPRPG